MDDAGLHGDAIGLRYIGVVGLNILQSRNLKSVEGNEKMLFIAPPPPKHTLVRFGLPSQTNMNSIGVIRGYGYRGLCRDV